MMNFEEAPISHLKGVFYLPPEEREKEMDRIEKQLGRYPLGWRHYENFENYSFKYPDKTIHDYHMEMNKECTYEEFIAINRA